MTDQITHIPKGGMCVGCANIKKDCSNLPFNTMPVISSYKNIVTVKCTEYTKNDSNQEIEEKNLP